jgi:hypothetical protein
MTEDTKLIAVHVAPFTKGLGAYQFVRLKVSVNVPEEYIAYTLWNNIRMEYHDPDICFVFVSFADWLCEKRGGTLETIEVYDD